MQQGTNQAVISVAGLNKTYASGHQALRAINLDIRRGEIFALLGPNGAGKTTLINIICGIVNPTEGRIVADGHDIIADYRAAGTVNLIGSGRDKAHEGRSHEGLCPSGHAGDRGPGLKGLGP